MKRKKINEGLGGLIMKKGIVYLFLIILGCLLLVIICGCSGDMPRTNPLDPLNPVNKDK